MYILKNGFRNSKEENRKLIEHILLFFIIFTVILTLYSSFNRHAESKEIKTSKIANKTERVENTGNQHRTISNEEAAPGIQP